MKLETCSDFSNHFLVAMPMLDCDIFSNSVTYICQHNKNGAFGFIINKSFNISLYELMDQTNIPCEGLSSLLLQTTKNDIKKINANLNSVLCGGPLDNQKGFVLHPSDTTWSVTTQISKELSMTTSADILEAIGRDPLAFRYLVSLGYASWEPNQLEAEILHNDWLTVPAFTDLLFVTPMKERLHSAANLIGVDLNLLSTGAVGRD